MDSEPNTNNQSIEISVIGKAHSESTLDTIVDNSQVATTGFSYCNLVDEYNKHIISNKFDG